MMSFDEQVRASLLQPGDIPWGQLDLYQDRNVFQTREWLNFIASTQAARPIVIQLSAENGVIGFFTGLVTVRLGVRILASPFPGWTTPYMGFNLSEGAPRSAALVAIQQLAFQQLGCLHVEVCDRNCKADDGTAGRFSLSTYSTYETDLRRSEDQLFQLMTSACRRCIRKADKVGVQIEQADDPTFASQYYEQLIEVFAKRKQRPTYPLSRVRSLIENLLPTGRLLLLRAKDQSGSCIATGIYVGMNKNAQFWGNASLKSHQHLRPNEALHWYAMRYWKNRGIEAFDWGGRGSYKEKYGVAKLTLPRFSKSRFSVIAAMRRGAQSFVNWRRGRHPDPESHNAEI